MKNILLPELMTRYLISVLEEELKHHSDYAALTEPGEYVLAQLRNQLKRADLSWDERDRLTRHPHSRSFGEADGRVYFESFEWELGAVIAEIVDEKNYAVQVIHLNKESSGKLPKKILEILAEQRRFIGINEA